MYKTVSTALQLPAMRLVLSMAVVTALGFVAYHNWMDLSLPGTDGLINILTVFLLVATLTFFNIYCESQKWKHLISSEAVDVRSAFAQVVAGICSGFLTPNRIGEFAGRRQMMPQGEKHKAFLVTIAGSGIQGSVTALFGLAGLMYFPFKPSATGVVFAEWVYLIFGILALLVIGLVFRKKAHRFKGMLRAIVHLRTLQASDILKAVLWAILRYLIFSTQFVIALVLLGYNGDIATCYAGVFLLYFCQSYIPGAAFGELGVRELLAVMIFGAWMPNPLLGALAGFMVWLANIGLPVLLGSAVFGLGLKRSV
jgi:hypothetical protein